MKPLKLSVKITKRCVIRYKYNIRLHHSKVTIATLIIAEWKFYSGKKTVSQEMFFSTVHGFVVVEFCG